MASLSCSLLEPKQLRRRLRHDDPSRLPVGNPRLDPRDALRIRDLVLETDEWPVGRPHELLRSAGVEERIDVRLDIGAALAVRRRELHERIARAHSAKDLLEPLAL